MPADAAVDRPAALATVIICNWNGERLLRPCLDALAQQTLGRPEAPGFQTWVVDNASGDGSVALLEREYPHVRILRNHTNLGFAGGNNTALRQVTTPFAVLLNNDATPEPDWLEQLLRPFDEPGAERLAAVTSKVVFAPRFLRLTLQTPGFSPGPHDPRELGLRLHRIAVDGQDVTGRVLMERLTWGPEGEGEARFSWTRPSGELLVPLPPGAGDGPLEVTFRWGAEQPKTAVVTWAGGAATLPVPVGTGEAAVLVPTDTIVDVVNNVGSIVLLAGYGADRGYQEVDSGQYDQPADVFALCGCAVAFRTPAGRQVDWFDDDFFLYYEDTDLSWRLRAAGWTIRYEPTAVVRHVHSATSIEWSPRFVFHTDRNRLLMLVKNAELQLAVRECLRYPLTTASMAVRALRHAQRYRTRPPVRPTLMRLRVMWSFLRLLAPMLAKRRQVARTATTTRSVLQQRLVAQR